MVGHIQDLDTSKELFKKVFYNFNESKKNPIVGVRCKLPEEVRSGTKLDLSFFRTFGSICYVYVPQELQTMLDTNSKKCICIGYSLE